MDEFKPGDRVMLKGALIEQRSFTHIGRVESLGTVVRVKWSNGRLSTEPPENIQLVHTAQPETSAAALMAYGAEKAELQRILTKRNATIGRLRAANRALRRELRARGDQESAIVAKYPRPVDMQDERLWDDKGDSIFEGASESEWETELAKQLGPHEYDMELRFILRRSYSSSVMYSQAPPSHAEYDRKVAWIDPGEPTPLPTVPPRLGGVYRTRGGDEAFCLRRCALGESLGVCGQEAHIIRRTNLDNELRYTILTNGHYLVSGQAHSLDLVAEVSPPPEPAFAGPLEVGGWYETRHGKVLHCDLIRCGHASCSSRDWSGTYRLDGVSRVCRSLDIIRKVDPPGGES